MPNKLPRGCAQSGCPELTTDPSCKCPEHRKEQVKRYDKDRGSSYTRGYDRRWSKARIRFLSENPLCVMCMERGFENAATVVDHKKAHKGDPELFWDEDNWQSLCKPDHDRKTAKENGWRR